ncbi:MAG: histidinol dehydrogenase [Desulfobacterota bacterium]|nr:histidinol dehydrogenase [Thermodesulfobacteriota bacterium]
MKVYTYRDKACRVFLESMRNRSASLTTTLLPTVEDIISQVRKGGDRALRQLTKKFDGHTRISVPVREIRTAYRKISPELHAALHEARQRIIAFHQQQLHTSWLRTGPYHEVFGQIVRPLERVGIYVPGGKAVYPSSVLMNALPARVAGVQEIVMVTPGTARGIDAAILAAADMCGIERVYQIGGAQAVAALAYGTQTVPRVDKIVGPGNIYVALAKKLVYGDVAIDMIAGPSEILIVNDGSGDPDWAAADLLSQAEHDEMASAVLITTSVVFARKVKAALARRIAMLPRSDIARASLARYGGIIVVRTIEIALQLANELAPEHLELFVHNPWEMLPFITNAGAVFLGHMTPEAIGDYIAGPNHVLPTGGTARFSSPLTVDDFLKKTSVIACTFDALATLGPAAEIIARSEALDAHAASVSVRLHAPRR